MRRLYVCSLIAVGAVSLGLWLGRTQVLAWYYARQLAGASAEDRDKWIARALSLDEAVLPFLVACLERNDDQACDNATAGLQILIDHWGLDDLRTISLSCRLSDAFPTMSAAGQAKTLDLERSWFTAGTNESHRPAMLSQRAARLLGEAARVPDPAVRFQALALATDLLAADGRKAADQMDADLLDICQALARTSLRDGADANRLQAIRLAQRPEVNLLGDVIPLLRDSRGAVRRAAILALGPAPEIIGDDDLLYWLNDPDAEVRQLCEMALRGRGLQENHIRLARLMTDRRPAMRLEVIDSLGRAADLEPGVWLRRLSHDPAPAVRAAAARAAASQTQADLSDRIEQMAQDDPSPTVQQVARYYLSCQRLRTAKPRTP